MWMNAAEVSFPQGRGRFARLGDGRHAGILQAGGIERPFEQYGLPGADDYANDSTLKPADYADPKRTKQQYQGPDRRDDQMGRDGRELERIITQKWIAIYPLGQEAGANSAARLSPLLPVVVMLAATSRRASRAEQEHNGNYDATWALLRSRRLCDPPVWNPEH